jgi:hypothetical protein
MPSVADFARARTRALALAMPASERMALALVLGDEAADLYARMNGVSPAEARQYLAAQRQRGRGPSAVTARHAPRP